MRAYRRRPKGEPRTHGRAVSRSPIGTGPVDREFELQVELPLPPALKGRQLPRAGAIALVDVEGRWLRLRFLRSPLEGAQAPAALPETEAALLTRGGVAAASRDDIRLSEGSAAAAYQELRAGSLTVERAAALLGVNASRIRQRLAAGSLYGLKEGNAWLLPAFQFTDKALVPNLDVVLRRLPRGLSPLAVAQWLSRPNPDLCTRDDEERPLSPRQWLLAGNPPEPAAELAAAL
jgi:hypothetical protein